MFMFEFVKNRSWTETNDLAYNATFAAVSSGYVDPEINTGMASETWRKDAYSFCNMSGTVCKGLFINTFETYKYYVNEYYYPVSHGACDNSFTSSDSYW